MKRINTARLSKLNHKKVIKDKENYRMMEQMFGVNTKEDDILNIEDWKNAQKKKDLNFLSENTELTEYEQDGEAVDCKIISIEKKIFSNNFFSSIFKNN